MHATLSVVVSVLGLSVASEWLFVSIPLQDVVITFIFVPGQKPQRLLVSCEFQSSSQYSENGGRMIIVDCSTVLAIFDHKLACSATSGPQ